MSKTVIKNFGEYAIPVSIDQDFGNLLNSIDNKFLAIEGLTRDYLDISKRYDEYSNEGLDTFSIEGNSNAMGAKNYLSRNGEVYKSLEKLLNYQLLWRECKKMYGLDRANKIIKEAIEGSYLVHDVTNNGVDSLYCTTLTAKHVMMEGRPYNDVHSKPPKYADSFMGQIIELIIDASSRFAGALAIPDINVAFSYYTKKENLSNEQIKQLYQRLVHLVNNPYRSGAQSPFYNMSLFTENGIISAFGGYEFPDGSTIFDYVDEIMKNQLIFAEYFGKGIEDDKGVLKPVAFPVVTINIIKETIQDDYEYIQKLINAFNKFDNVNIYLGAQGKFASCCRLVNDTNKKNAINSFGAGAIGETITGSSRVISINLYDIALETKQKFNDSFKEHYFELLEEKMMLAKEALVAQRYLVQRRLNEGFNIFYNIGWIKLEDYFSTYGAGGLHEAAKTICEGNLQEDYTQEELEWASKVPKFMEDFADENSDDFVKLNVEFLTPLESGAKRLGRRIDIKYEKRNTFVSNQLLPLPIKTTMARRLEIENFLGGTTSAGGILHIGTEGEMPIDMKMSLLNKIINKYPNVEHFAFNKTSSYCEDGHLTLANVDKCSFCHKPIVEKILRVIGYYKPVKQWSTARQEEFSKRYFNTMDKQREFIQEGDKNED